jgi:hypothetical protein
VEPDQSTTDAQDAQRRHDALLSTAWSPVNGPGSAGRCSMSTFAKPILPQEHDALFSVTDRSKQAARDREAYRDQRIRAETGLGAEGALAHERGVPLRQRRKGGDTVVSPFSLGCRSLDPIDAAQAGRSLHPPSTVNVFR